ncbi:hypothetical protein DFH06DRAFT_1346327 [Mycena polygramma]|nr:hypothetical protein DFH06DRAFT_1346327 [Mycena polygramma]
MAFPTVVMREQHAKSHPAEALDGPSISKGGRTGVQPGAQLEVIVGVVKGFTRTADLSCLDEDDGPLEGCASIRSADRYARGPLGYDCAAVETGWGGRHALGELGHHGGGATYTAAVRRPLQRGACPRALTGILDLTSPCMLASSARAGRGACFLAT